MDNLNDSLKKAKIQKEEIERQKKAELNSIIKPYRSENKLKALRAFIKSNESSKTSYEYILEQQKDINVKLRETQENLERMKSVAIPSPSDYIDGFIPTQNQYDEIYNSINNVNWMEIYNSVSQSIINLKYPFINLFLQQDEFSKTLYEHVKKIDDDELNEIFTLNFLKKK